MKQSYARALGGGRHTIPIKLYLDGYRAAVDLFWHRRALVRFNIDYLFERDEYDWVFDPEIAQRLDKLFRGIGESLLSVDWSREVELDLLKRIYQNVVPREGCRTLPNSRSKTCLSTSLSQFLQET